MLFCSSLAIGPQAIYLGSLLQISPLEKEDWIKTYTLLLKLWKALSEIMPVKFWIDGWLRKVHFLIPLPPLLCILIFSLCNSHCVLLKIFLTVFFPLQDTKFLSLNSFPRDLLFQSCTFCNLSIPRKLNTRPNRVWIKSDTNLFSSSLSL